MNIFAAAARIRGSEPRKNPEKQRFSVNKIQQKQPCFVKADIAGTNPVIPFYWQPLAGRRDPQKTAEKRRANILVRDGARGRKSEIKTEKP